VSVLCLWEREEEEEKGCDPGLMDNTNERAKRKFLVDCDPGIDDSLALLFLFSHLQKNENELVGVTIVHGNNPSVKVLRSNALLLLSSFGFDGVEVVAGASNPLKRTYQGHAGMLWHGSDGLGEADLSQILSLNSLASNNNDDTTNADTNTTNPAAAFMYEKAKEEDGELEIICMGPLTNLGGCLELYGTSFSSKIKRVTLMGGMVRTMNPGGNVSPLSEANVFNDPEAADVVFSSSWKNPLRMVPLDITEKTRISFEKLKEFKEMNSKAGNFIWSIIQFYYKRYEFVREEQENERKNLLSSVPATHAYLLDDSNLWSDTWEKNTIPTHDSSSVMAALHPDCYTWRPLLMKVLKNDDVSRGLCVGYRPSESSLFKGETIEGAFMCNVCEVAWDVNVDLFMSTFFEHLRKLH